ncbi:FecR family protein [Brevundimonas sp.]|uniref:FecR family protein n=1 Tax=Brevundimonas sp. TaxID=1871086 RepID=UPI0028AB7D14|nr:FecR domain-containing protein [Brevundimonas sp.]
MKADEKRMMVEAAAWVEWSGRPMTEAADAAAFEAWMGRSEAHRAAFADLAALWRSDALGEAVERAAPKPAKRHRSPWRFLIPAGTAVAASVVVAGLLAPFSDYRTVETARAEQRTIVLADGTSVQMNGGARLKVRQGLLGRTIALEQGEAFFDVHHDGRRFTVTTGDGRIQVMGTAFNVDRLSSGQTEVSLYRGAVRLKGRGKTEIDLKPGERAVLERGRVRRASPAAAVAPDWMDGWFDAEDASLEQLVEEMDRFSATPIVVDGHAARKRVSGRFRVSKPASVLDLIAVAYDVSVSNENGRVLIRDHNS